MGAMGSCRKDVAGKTEAIQEEEKRKQAAAVACKAAQDEERAKEITLVLLELNGNPSKTFPLKLNLQEQPQALLEYICKLATLPKSWDCDWLHESDLALSIGDAAISDEMSLHQNGQCCLPDGCNPLSLNGRMYVLRRHRRDRDHCDCAGCNSRSLAADEEATGRAVPQAWSCGWRCR